MEYRCIKEMILEKYDGDGCSICGYGTVPIGSIWYEDDSSNILGGEIHLECKSGADDFGWIEITMKDLAAYFELTDCDEQCREDVTSCEYWDTEKCKLHN